MIFNKERAKQLEARILKLSQVQKEIHSQQFPKDGTEGEYELNQKLDAPLKWDDTPSVLRIRRVINIISKLRRELLAINYYNAVMNSKNGVSHMIRKASDTINEYDYSGFNQDIEIDNLFPKSEEEIEK
tara:strand:- start:643 stop:1029 length:387 start_codon:yes stop_codon:yes gene_type:complete